MDAEEPVGAAGPFADGPCVERFDALETIGPERTPQLAIGQHLRRVRRVALAMHFRKQRSTAESKNGKHAAQEPLTFVVAGW